MSESVPVVTPNAVTVRTAVPMLLTVARIPLGWLYPVVSDRPALAISLLGAAAVTDMLDGALARRWHTESASGAMLDGLTDKIFAIEVVYGLLRAKRLHPTEAALTFVREGGEAVLALAVLARPETRWGWVGRERANALGKATTVLQAATHLAAQVGLRKWVRPLAWATAVTGAASVADYWRRDRRDRRYLRAQRESREPGERTTLPGLAPYVPAR